MRVAVLGAGGRSRRRSSATSPTPRRSPRCACSTSIWAEPRRSRLEHGGGKAQARQADATADLAEQLAGMEVLVNSAPYPINLAAMQRLPRGRLPLHGPRRPIPRDHRAARAQSARVRAGRPARPPGGRSAPGKTNLLAARAVRSSAASRPRSRSRRGGRDLDPPGELAFPYALRTLLDEITMAPNGADQRQAEGDAAAPGRPARRLRGADRRGRHHLHLAFRVLHVRRQFPGAQRDLCALAVTNGARELPQGPGGGERGADCGSRPFRIAPFSATTLSIHVVEVARRGHPVIRARPASRPPTRPGAWAAGSSPPRRRRPRPSGSWPAASITKRGALPPESCIDPDEMFAELESRGVRFDVEQLADRQGGDALASKASR